MDAITEIDIAGDVDYTVHGQGYALQRRTDPRLAALVHEALGSARTVLNVGAGAGSYEPLDRYVLAIEPSAAMRAQRPSYLTPAIHGVAEYLPLDDKSIDASMAMVTDPAALRSQSAWTFVTDAVKAHFNEALGEDLASGEWDSKYGGWRKMPQFEGSLRLLVGGSL